MSRTLRHPVLQWLVYGHLWLALGIAAQVWWIGQFLTDAPEFWRYILAAGCGTVAAYSLMRWVRSRNPHLIASEHLQWVRERRMTVLVLSVVCCLAAAVLCWPLQWHIIRWLVPAGFVAVLYVSPFSGKDGQAIGLRQVPGLKVLLIAFVCVSITVAVPMAYDEVGHNTTEIVLMMCMRLPLFMAITIAFDIRDTAFDPPSLRTIPQLLGVRGAKAIAILLLICVLARAGLCHFRIDRTAWLCSSNSVGCLSQAAPRPALLWSFVGRGACPSSCMHVAGNVII